MYILKFVLSVCILDAESAGKAVAEVVACSGLKRFSVMHQRFDGIGGLSACEFLFVCFLSFDHRDRQDFLAEIRVYVQHLDRSLLSLFCGGMGRMSLLPQKFSGTEERTGGFFPAHNRTPLIIYLGKISVGLDIFLIKITEQRLRGRTHAETFLKRFQTAVCHPGNLRRESFHMILLFLKKRFRNKHGHVHVLHACFFEFPVKLMLDIFPEGISRRFDDHTSFYAGIPAQLGFFYHVGIPLGEILLHGSNRFNQFLFFCHDSSPFLLLICCRRLKEREAFHI